MTATWLDFCVRLDGPKEKLKDTSVKCGMAGSANPSYIERPRVVSMMTMNEPNIAHIHSANAADRGLANTSIMHGLFESASRPPLVNIPGRLCLKLLSHLRPISRSVGFHGCQQLSAVAYIPRMILCVRQFRIVFSPSALRLQDALAVELVPFALLQGCLRHGLSITGGNAYGN